MGLSKTYQGGSIQLDNYSRSYFAGEMVKGRPIVSIPKQIKAKGNIHLVVHTVCNPETMS